MFFIITSIIIYQFYKKKFLLPNINPHGKYVLVTGCGSGFGYALAIELDQQGFNVFAGVRVISEVNHF